jgi:ABC-type transporter Mla subunit MlaD
MKVSLNSKRVALMLALAALILSPAFVLAQDQASLSLQNVKDQLKQNKNYLDQASKQGKAGDAAGMQTALDNYDRSMDGLNTVLSHAGGFSGSASQREDALARVSDATSKHIKTLQGLLSKVPAQAQGAIQNAITVSQKGHDMATASLQASHVRDQSQSGRPSGVGGGRPAGVGAPAGVGRPSGHPGRP